MGLPRNPFLQDIILYRDGMSCVAFSAVSRLSLNAEAVFNRGRMKACDRDNRYRGHHGAVAGDLAEEAPLRCRATRLSVSCLPGGTLRRWGFLCVSMQMLPGAPSDSTSSGSDVATGPLAKERSTGSRTLAYVSPGRITQRAGNQHRPPDRGLLTGHQPLLSHPLTCMASDIRWTAARYAASRILTFCFRCIM